MIPIKKSCATCGRPYAGNTDSLEYQCGSCKKGSKTYYAKARSIGLYYGTLKKIIQHLKYRKIKGIAPKLADWMIEHMPEDMYIQKYDFILPAPIHIRRLRQREFNQSLILAKPIAKYYSRPLMLYNLYRKKMDQAQAGLNRNLRITNVKGDFGIKYPERIKDKKLLLIDDVYTTGATVRECAKVLLKSGAQQVDVLTLARTEDRR